MAEIPTHIVVDTRDGMCFYKDGKGRLFDESVARRFADHRNREQIAPSYVVTALTLVPQQPGIHGKCANCRHTILFDFEADSWRMIDDQMLVGLSYCAGRDEPERGHVPDRY